MSEAVMDYIDRVIHEYSIVLLISNFVLGVAKLTVQDRFLRRFCDISRWSYINLMRIYSFKRWRTMIIITSTATCNEIPVWVVALGLSQFKRFISSRQPSIIQETYC